MDQSAETVDHRVMAESERPRELCGAHGILVADKGQDQEIANLDVVLLDDPGKRIIRLAELRQRLLTN